MVLHRSLLVRRPLIGLRRLLCSLYVHAVTGLPALYDRSAPSFSAVFGCSQSLPHVLSSLSTTRCLCVLAPASCRLLCFQSSVLSRRRRVHLLGSGYVLKPLSQRLVYWDFCGGFPKGRDFPRGFPNLFFLSLGRVRKQVRLTISD